MPGRLPAQVPLPEVAQHTEDIVFGGLGLPVGFDQERLLINVRALDRFRKVAGLDTISIVADQGEAEPTDPGVTGVDSQGTATIGLAAKRTRKPLVSGKLQYPIPNNEVFGRPDGVVKVDNTELESRLEAKPKKYPKGPFDAKGRGKFLNAAVKRGLSEVNFDTSFSFTKGILAGSWVGSNAFTFFELGVPLPVVIASGVGANGLLASLNAYGHAADSQEFKQFFMHHRHSLFYGITPDRYIAAQGILSARRLIKARS